MFFTLLVPAKNCAPNHRQDKHLVVSQRIYHRSISSYKKADTKPRSLGKYVLLHCCYIEIILTSFNRLLRYFLHQHQCHILYAFGVFQNTLQFTIYSQKKLKGLFSPLIHQHRRGKKVKNRKEEENPQRFKLH